MEIMLHTQDATAVINTHGAELTSLKKGATEYVWQADPAYWNRHAPVLFPFVGAVANKEYRVSGTTYPMGQHGFARDSEFELVSSTETTALFRLASTAQTRERYPFDFVLEIGYGLSGSTLTTTWTVSNPENAASPLHFSIGAHPAFNCNLAGASVRISKNGAPLARFEQSLFADGYVTYEKQVRTLGAEAGATLGAGATLAGAAGVALLDEHSFDGDAWVLEGDQADCVELFDAAGKPLVTVRFQSPVVGIWSPPKKNAPFICIEPWYGRADHPDFAGDISERDWNNTLDPGASFHASFTITAH